MGGKTYIIICYMLHVNHQGFNVYVYLFQKQGQKKAVMWETNREVMVMDKHHYQHHIISSHPITKEETKKKKILSFY